MGRDTGFPLRVRVVIIERSGGICEKCGEARPGMQVHHRRPRGMGGSRRDCTNGPANGLYLCAACHHEVEHDRLKAYVYGWLVRQQKDPAEVTVRRHGRWVFLTNDGDVEEVGAA